MGSKRNDTLVFERLRGLERRDFLKAAAAAAATGALSPAKLLAHETGAPRALLQERQEAPLVPLGNGEHPALVFQAYPGGTGALMEKLWKDYDGNAFERAAFEVEPWRGSVPGDPEDVAFLPVHRLSALIQGRHISSADLTEIYLDRMKRYDPILLCAVTILEDRAREEAQQADSDLRNGNYRGPLHGIPYGIKDLFSVAGVRTTWITALAVGARRPNL